jgi:hypothetical protein
MKNGGSNGNPFADRSTIFSAVFAGVTPELSSR